LRQGQLVLVAPDRRPDRRSSDRSARLRLLHQSRAAGPRGAADRGRRNAWRSGGGAMKKLIDKPEDVVTEALHGIAAAHPDLVKVHFNPHFIVRADAPVQGKVGLVSGGGSGHEPMHGGFVGPGMLDAACPGEVFTSPTPDQM